jgi:hypothetical protein
MHSLHSTPTLTMSQKPSAELLPFKISTPCVSLAASKTYYTNLKCQLHPSSQNFDNLGSRIPAKDSTLQQACVFSHHGFAEWKWKTDQRGAATEGLPGAWQKVHISSWGTCFFFCQCTHATLEKILGYNLLLIISAHYNAFPCIFCYYFSRVAYSLLGAAEGSQNKKEYWKNSWRMSPVPTGLICHLLKEHDPRMWKVMNGVCCC